MIYLSKEKNPVKEYLYKFESTNKFIILTTDCEYLTDKTICDSYILSVSKKINKK